MFPPIKGDFDDDDFNRSIKFISLPILEPLVRSIVDDLANGGNGKMNPEDKND
jgi:hypothetical protein